MVGRRYGRGQPKTGVMNKLETAYSLKLENDKHLGLIQWYAFEAMKFRLAKKTFYTPDFIVLTDDGFIQAHEVKGFWEDDARVKIKCAAEKFPIKFIAIQRKKKEWVIEEF